MLWGMNEKEMKRKGKGKVKCYENTHTITDKLNSTLFFLLVLVSAGRPFPSLPLSIYLSIYLSLGAAGGRYSK